MGVVGVDGGGEVRGVLTADGEIHGTGENLGGEERGGVRGEKGG